MTLIRKRIRFRMVFISMLGAGAALALAACGGDGGEASGTFPVQLTNDSVSAGREIYSTNCASCHGGFSGVVPPLPSTPSHDAEVVGSHTWHHADRQLYEWILDRPPLATLMPAFRGTLTEEEVRDVIAYIKSEWPDDVRERQEDFTRQYELQLAETGS